MSRAQSATLLLFGSPLFALILTGAVAVIVIALAPGLVLPVLVPVWLLDWLLAGLGSAAGGMLHDGSDDRRTFLGIAGFFGGVAAYLLLCAIPYLLYVLYVMTFEFI